MTQPPSSAAENILLLFDKPTSDSITERTAPKSNALHARTSQGPATVAFSRPILIRHDSEFSVSTAYTAGTEGEPKLSMWQGAALLTAECLGTGLLALPANARILGLPLGIAFLVSNLPINLYAGTIFHWAATAIEERQVFENQIYQDNLALHPGDEVVEDEDGDNPTAMIDYEQVNQNTCSSVLSALSVDGLYNVNYTYNRMQQRGDKYNSNQKTATTTNYSSLNQNTLQSNFSLMTTGTAHTRLHHDTATYDFIGMTQCLFEGNRLATRLVQAIYYTNLFLVMGNYILVMAHAVSAVFGEAICLPVAGGMASVGMFVVSQMRSMAKLGQTASFVSLGALFVVVVQCLWALHHEDNVDHNVDDDGFTTGQDDDDNHIMRNLTADHTAYTFLRKLTALGSIGFACSGQKLFLNIRHDLTRRAEAPKTLGIGIATFGMFYVAIILLAGSHPPALLFDAIPQGTVSRRIAGLLLWGHVIVSYAINSQAICSSLDRLSFHRCLRMPGRNDPVTRWAILTGFMAVLAYTVANLIPFFDDLVSLIGGLTGVPLTLLLPAIFYRKHLSVRSLWWSNPINSSKESIVSAALLFFSMLFMVTATAGAIHSITIDWGKHGPPFSCH